MGRLAWLGRLDRLKPRGRHIGRWCRDTGRARRAVCWAVVLEESVPGGVDGVWVGEVLLVELVNEPLVGTELTGARVLLGRHVGAVSLAGCWLTVAFAAWSRSISPVSLDLPPE